MTTLISTQVSLEGLDNAEPMTVEQPIDNGQSYFDLLQGRVEISLVEGIANTWGYDHWVNEAEAKIMILKMSDGNPGAITVLVKLLDSPDLSVIVDVLDLDTHRCYGHRIYELYKLCGEDIERFRYHIQMELPNQETGQISITGPYCSQVDTDAHSAARRYGKPGSLFSL